MRRTAAAPARRDTTAPVRGGRPAPTRGVGGAELCRRLFSKARAFRSHAQKSREVAAKKIMEEKGIEPLASRTLMC